MNERTIELIDIAPKDFWGAQDTHLETIKKYYPKLKIVARGTTMKVVGEKEALDEFEKRFNRQLPPEVCVVKHNGCTNIQTTK